MAILPILFCMALTSSGGDPAWNVLETLRRELTAGGETTEAFVLDERPAGGAERQTVVEIGWQLPERIVLVDEEGVELGISVAEPPTGPVARGLYELLLRPLPALAEEYSVRLRPGRPGQLSLELSRERGAGPRSLRVRFRPGGGRLLELQIVDSGGGEHRLWVEEDRAGFDRPGAALN